MIVIRFSTKPVPPRPVPPRPPWTAEAVTIVHGILAFYNERLGEPYGPDPEHQRFYQLADEYHRQCDAYDASICTGHLQDGTAVPVNSSQACRIAAFARQLVADIVQRERLNPVQAQQFIQAIRNHRGPHAR